MEAGARCKSSGPPPVLTFPSALPPPLPVPITAALPSVLPATLDVRANPVAACAPPPPPPPALELEVSRGDIKITMRCFQSSALSDIVPAVRQVVNMLENQQASSRPESLQLLDQRPQALCDNSASRTANTNAAEEALEARYDWHHITHAPPDEDRVDLVFRVIKVFYVESSLSRSFPHGAEYQLDGFFFTPVSLRGLVFKHIKVDQLAHRHSGKYHWGTCIASVWKYALLSFRILIVRKTLVRSNGRT